MKPQSKAAAAPPRGLFPDDGAGGAIAPQPPTDEVVRLSRVIPRSVRLGTCSWAFPGWRGMVWSRFSGTRGLAADGLRAYSSFPLFRTVEIDRSYYRSLTLGNYWHFAEQVPRDFRFMVKAPSSVTDFAERGPGGRPKERNPFFLDASRAASEFMGPVLEGLGRKAGPLIFEFARLDRGLVDTLEKRIRFIERLGEFLAALPRPGDEASGAFFAVEIRTPALLTPRYLAMLRDVGARLVIGLHPSMPGVERQIAAIKAMDDPEADISSFRLSGPLVIRWNLALGDRFDDARRRFEPFDRLQRPDPVTREGVTALVAAAMRGGSESFFAVNNKAEGCAPLSVLEVARRLSERVRASRKERDERRRMPLKKGQDRD